MPTVPSIPGGESATVPVPTIRPSLSELLMSAADMHAQGKFDAVDAQAQRGLDFAAKEMQQLDQRANARKKQGWTDQKQKAWELKLKKEDEQLTREAEEWYKKPQ